MKTNMMEIVSVLLLFLIGESVALNVERSCEITCKSISDLGSRISSLETNIKVDDGIPFDFLELDNSLRSTRARVSLLTKKVNGLAKTVQQQAQIITTLLHKVEEMDIEKDILVTNVQELQEQLLEQKIISSSLQTQLGETVSNSSTVMKGITESLSVISNKMIDQDVMCHVSVEGLKQDIMSVRSTVGPLTSSIDVLSKAQRTFNQSLSVNQQDTNELKQNFSNISDTLLIFQQDLANLSSELHRNAKSDQHHLHENLTVHMDIKKEDCNNTRVMLAKYKELKNKSDILRRNFTRNFFTILGNMKRITENKSTLIPHRSFGLFLGNRNINITTPISVETSLSPEDYNNSSFTENESNDETRSYKTSPP